MLLVDQRGSFVIEIALIAPIFFLLLFVIGETTLLFIAERSMDRAVGEAAATVRGGHAMAAALDEDQFRAQICARTVMIDCKSSDFFVDVRAYERPADIDATVPLKADHTYARQAEFQYGEPGDIVILRAYYQWQTNPIYGSLSINNLGNGKRLISAFAAFRNEPFADPTDGAAAR